MGPERQVFSIIYSITEKAERGRFDYLLIESTGVSEPIPVAQTFTFEDEDGVSLAKVSRLDTMVTVVDAASFMNDFQEGEMLLANVIVLNKLDLVDNATALRIEAAIKALNPGAKTLMAVRGQVPLEAILDTGLFDYEEAASSAGWIRELQVSTRQKPKNTVHSG